MRLPVVRDGFCGLFSHVNNGKVIVTSTVHKIRKLLLISLKMDSKFGANGYLVSGSTLLSELICLLKSSEPTIEEILE